jgi:predicted transglutaminase-like cysteine proteinase
MKAATVLAAVGLIVAVALAPTADALAQAAPAGTPPKPSFFNSQEVESTILKPFTKWTEALEKYTKESALVQKEGCTSTQFTTCHYLQWRKFLGTLVGKDKLAQITEVNAYMNKATYIADETNWGQKDYWESPGEFMAKFGDCEDYAIAKFMSLVLLGFDPNNLRVVAVKDLNLKVGHAILAAFVDDKVYILDNQINQVVEAKSIRHYEPVFSINQTKWWHHRVGQGG